MNKYKINAVEVLTFQNVSDLHANINTVEMNKIIHEEFNPDEELYIFTLDNGDVITLNETEHDKIVLFVSEKRLTYKPVVNENEDRDDLPIEYVGFQLVR